MALLGAVVLGALVPGAPADADPSITVDQSVAASPGSSSLSISTAQENELILIAANG